MRHEYEVLKIAGLSVDMRYQRGPKSKINKIVKNWSEEKAGTIEVGRRSDKSLWIVDGHQRVSAMVILGKLKVKAMVFTSRGFKHEAEVYDDMNGNRTNQTPTEKFRARMAYDETVAVDIMKTIKAADFDIPYQDEQRKGVAWGRLQCVRSVERLHNKGVLQLALKLFNTCWKEQPASCTEGFLNGLGHFLLVYDGDLDEKKFIRKLSKKTAEVLLAEATSKQVSRTQTSSNVALAGVFFRIYNNHNSQKLSEAKLVIASSK